MGMLPSEYSARGRCFRFQADAIISCLSSDTTLRSNQGTKTNASRRRRGVLLVVRGSNNCRGRNRMQKGGIGSWRLEFEEAGTAAVGSNPRRSGSQPCGRVQRVKCRRPLFTCVHPLPIHSSNRFLQRSPTPVSSSSWQPCTRLRCRLSLSSGSSPMAEEKASALAHNFGAEDIDESLWDSPVKPAQKANKAQLSKTAQTSKPKYEDQEARDQALRRELADVRRVNETIEGVIQSLEKAKTNMKVCERC